MDYKIYKSKGSPDNWGVQAIVYEDPRVGWTIATGSDYYIKREDRWVGVDLAGLLDHIVNELGIVLVGRTISNQEYHRIYEKALADRDFARKSARLPREREDVLSSIQSN